MLIRITAYCRDNATNKSIHELTTKVSDADFYHAFQTTKDNVDSLIANHSISINRLMELVLFFMHPNSDFFRFF